MVVINVAVPLHHTHPYCGGGRVCVSVILPHDRCDATSAAFRLVQQGVCVIQQHSELFGCSSSSSSRWRSGETKLIELAIAASAPQPTNLSRDVFTFGSRVRGGLYSDDNNNNASIYQGIVVYMSL